MKAVAVAVAQAVLDRASASLIRACANGYKIRSIP